jgi:DNA-binding LacI/PurR family transcriptional regulator
MVPRYPRRRRYRDRRREDMAVDSCVTNIRINYQNGIRQGVQHLAALRHTSIAFVTGPLHLKSALARNNAFKTR